MQGQRIKTVLIILGVVVILPGFLGGSHQRASAQTTAAAPADAPPPVTLNVSKGGWWIFKGTEVHTTGLAPGTVVTWQSTKAAFLVHFGKGNNPCEGGKDPVSNPSTTQSSQGTTYTAKCTISGSRKSAKKNSSTSTSVPYQIMSPPPASTGDNVTPCRGCVLDL
jgi:hypothetical protein